VRSYKKLSMARREEKKQDKTAYRKEKRETAPENVASMDNNCRINTPEKECRELEDRILNKMKRMEIRTPRNIPL